MFTSIFEKYFWKKIQDTKKNLIFEIRRPMFNNSAWPVSIKKISLIISNFPIQEKLELINEQIRKLNVVLQMVHGIELPENYVREFL